MSISEDLKRYGKKSLMVWLPDDLHKAVKTKVAQKGITVQELITRLLMVYTQFKRPEEADADK